MAGREPAFWPPTGKSVLSLGFPLGLVLPGPCREKMGPLLACPC